MDLYFKPVTLNTFIIPEATHYRIWSEELKKHLRIYTYKNKSYVKVPGSSWYEIISKKNINVKTLKLK